jgi:dethiobiotin synthetase
MSSFFITSSGTELGKTFVTQMLIRQLRMSGQDCVALKPVVSGFDANVPLQSDTGKLLVAQNLPVTEESMDGISPWRFKAPISPDMAARREHRHIDLVELVDFCRASQGAGITLIEGVGGVMAPVNHDCTVLDWIAALEVPSVLVVGSYLGAISHALTAADALARAGSDIAGIVVNQSEVEPVPTSETADALRRHLGQTRLCVLPKKPAGSDLSTPDLTQLLIRYLS